MTRLRRAFAAHVADAYAAPVVGDQQVRPLLGSMPEPDPAQVQERAGRTTERFLALFGAG